MDNNNGLLLRCAGIPEKRGAIMKIKIIAILVAGLISSAVAQAGDVGVSADVGTLGAGVHLIIPIQDNLNVRLGFNGYNTTYAESTTDVNYDLKVKLQTIDTLLDWYPMSLSLIHI